MSHRIAASLLAAGLLTAGSALAAPRTYVASYGNDANAATNCGPTAPCRTFVAAMPVVDAGGQVIVLDSAGYGAVTITKSLSIIAPDGIYAGLTAATGNIITIATAGVEVTLKGLTLTFGDYGINMTNGAKLNVENCEISGAAGSGIDVEAAAKVTVAHSTIRDNAAGIRAGTGATLNVRNSQLTNNSLMGIFLSGGTTGTTTVSISDATVTGSMLCIVNGATAATTGVMNVTRSAALGCGTGISNEPLGTGTMTVSNSVVTLNGTGFNNAGGSFFSLGNNHVRQNGTDTSGTITVVSQN